MCGNSEVNFINKKLISNSKKYNTFLFYLLFLSDSFLIVSLSQNFHTKHKRIVYTRPWYSRSCYVLSNDLCPSTYLIQADEIPVFIYAITMRHTIINPTCETAERTGKRGSSAGLEVTMSGRVPSKDRGKCHRPCGRLIQNESQKIFRITTEEIQTTKVLKYLLVGAN